MYSIGTPQNSWNYHERCQTGSSMDTMCRCEVIRPPRNCNRGYGIMRQQDSVKAMQHSIRKTLCRVRKPPILIIYCSAYSPTVIRKIKASPGVFIVRVLDTSFTLTLVISGGRGHAQDHLTVLTYPHLCHIQWTLAC